MPKNKDLKRLVRARMGKTGESYTTARRHVLARSPERAPAASATTPKPVPTPMGRDFAAIAGIRDKTIEARTGCTWRKWVEALDYAKAEAMSHTEIAALVRAKWKVSSWWAQTITVGYERIRGRRDVHQRRGGYAVTKSKTFAVSVEHLAAAFAPSRRRVWLGDEPVEERKSGSGRVARWRQRDGTKVQVQFVAKGPHKATAQLQHDGLAAKADVERWRHTWTRRFEALAAALASPDATATPSLPEG